MKVEGIQALQMNMAGTKALSPHGTRVLIEPPEN